MNHSYIARGRKSGRTVSLREFPKNGFLLLLFYSDTRVSHREAQQNRLFVSLFENNFRLDFAVFGELERIAHQIHDDLSQPGRISHKSAGQFRWYATGELHSFLVGV